jgi:competence protein ComFC
MDNLLNILFTPKCLFCGAVGKFFCESCLADCEVMHTQRCIVCDKPSPKGITHVACAGLRKFQTTKAPSQLICFFIYENKVRECIKKSKYGAKQFLALKDLSRAGANLFVHDPSFGEMYKALAGYTLVPVPISRLKEKSRGFNQVDAIVSEISKVTKLQKQNSILTRIKDTKAQHSNTRAERFANVKEAFYAQLDDVAGKKFVVVDDICTSGATLLEAAGVLYEAGAVDVKCLALSKKLL